MVATALTRPAQALTGRAHHIFSLDFSSISASDFRTLTLDQLQQEAPELLYRSEESTDHFGKSILLTPAGEQYLFRKWNFLKYTASKLRKKLKSNDNIHLIDQIETLWSEAQQVRSQLIQANIRLVVSLAYKYASDSDEADDFVSEGNLILMQAVEKFDYSRGFRFSTYATHAVQRHFFRLIQRRQKRKQRENLSPGELLRNVSAPAKESSEFTPQMAGEIIRRLHECLTPRERTIVERRFGLLGKEEETLKTIAEQVGLSKERIRQLQVSALEKLKQLAIELKLPVEMDCSSSVDR